MVTGESRDAYRRIMATLGGQGAEAIILGCTEISLLVQPEDSALPLFDTTALHATRPPKRRSPPDAALALRLH